MLEIDLQRQLKADLEMKTGGITYLAGASRGKTEVIQR